MVDDHDQVALAAAVADLVDADPLEIGEGIGARAGIGHHARDDAAHGPPGDAQELADRGLRAVGRQPGRLVVEGAGVARLVAGPRDRGHDDPVLRAAHPWRVGLQVRQRAAQVERAPAPAALAAVVPRALPAAAPAAPALPLPRTHPGDDRACFLVELDPLHHRPLDTEQPRPYLCLAHAVSTLPFPVLICRKT